ncbi:hypothetical protein Q765_00385 [Flavobacterium rivuli WB 3.3-2 = DSM 21788]|uniref:Uncharacterized protein n=1 Tax=Flavobacterium rivuli WB 3.3-2 = DSM 21788 TaxID=1121895 RepID=A0A0A2M6X1_9FLAO|nr:hypothetical protein [Flavobacterium rivuli]KGO88407.1 hypothetical protein Q765_00385 [Flavobacterium rivuli WB 3.3-2 = DSM 21788]
MRIVWIRVYDAQTRKYRPGSVSLKYAKDGEYIDSTEAKEGDCKYYHQWQQCQDDCEEFQRKIDIIDTDHASDSRPN